MLKTTSSNLSQNTLYGKLSSGKFVKSSFAQSVAWRWLDALIGTVPAVLDTTPHYILGYYLPELVMILIKLSWMHRLARCQMFQTLAILILFLVEILVFILFLGLDS